MLPTTFTILASALLLPISSALGQTPAPGTPDATTGGLADWWWVVVLILVAAAVWYFMSRRTRI